MPLWKKLVPALVPLILLLTVIALPFSQVYPRGIPAVLPNSWPVPEFELPPGATQDFAHNGSTGAIFNTHMFVGGDHDRDAVPAELWAIGFDTELTWDELTKFWDDCLRDSDYWFSSNLDPKPLKKSRTVYGFRKYISQDGLILITIYYQKKLFTLGMPPYKAYCYNVKVFESTPEWFDPQYYEPIN